MTRTAALLCAICLVGLPACRPSAASFVPTVELGVRVSQVRARRHRHEAAGARGDLASLMFVRLNFQRRAGALALPSPGQASGLALMTPCAEDDLTCLKEAAEAERAFAALREELP